MNYTFDAARGILFGKRGKPITNKNLRGYIVANCRGKFVGSAHRIIWESVHGPIPDGMQINHINGVKCDNRIENLELVTPSENTKHAYRIGLRRADGEYNGRFKHGLYTGRAAMKSARDRSTKETGEAQ